MCQVIGKNKVRLESFGSVIGMTFNSGGCAEILMTQAEVGRFLDALLKIENQKPRPDEKTSQALRVLLRRVYRFRAEIVAAVPIAKVRALVLPVIPSGNGPAVEREIRELHQVLGGLAFPGKPGYTRELLARGRRPALLKSRTARHVPAVKKSDLRASRGDNGLGE